MEPMEAPEKHAEGGSAVERIYEQLKNMAIGFEFLPGIRLNEIDLARKVGVSRTPVREALNRLTADGYLTFSPKQGFYRKPLAVAEIRDLYELREQLERGVARLAVERASEAALDQLEAFLDTTIDVEGKTSDEVLAFDEGFHQRLAALTGNNELCRALENVNGRIRYVRWINMEGRRNHTQSEHREILRALRARNLEKTEALLAGHIMLRHEQIVSAVKDAFARIYMGEQGAVIG